MQKAKNIIFYVFLFLICLSFASHALGYDYDLWARLIVGKYVFQTGHILTHDFLSYTPTHEWIDHEWGASVIIYAFQHWFGPAGIVWLQTILTFLIFYFAFKVIELNIPNHISKYNIVFYFFAIYVIQDVFFYPVRCHMFTFMFFAMFLYILEYVRIKQNYKVLAILPLLMILWNNIHGGMVAGLGLMLIYAIGEALNKKTFKYYIYAFLATIPLLLINPYGFKYLQFLLMANTMARKDIVEWWGIFSPYHMYSYFAFKYFMLFILGLECVKVFRDGFSYARADKTKFLLILATTVLAVQHLKLIRFFVIVGIAFAYVDFYSMIKDFSLTKWKNLVIYTFLALFCFSLLRVADYRPKVSFVFPVLETEFVKVNNLKGNILVNLGLGSYVSYKLYPNNLIYMDGRYEEVYYDEMIPLLKKFHLVADGWDEVLKKYPPDVMILENEYPIINKLTETSNWHEAYRGNRFTVLVSNKLKKESYQQPTMNFTHYENSIFDTNIDFRKKN
ncbi:hypothetical protein IJ818_06055 [bacterium]|nr:hypothetical protein [bacterium]